MCEKYYSEGFEQTIKTDLTAYIAWKGIDRPVPPENVVIVEGDEIIKW